MEVVSSNVNQIQVPQAAGQPRPFVAVPEIQAEFLRLKQLNKHAHLRVSPYPLDNKAFQGPVALFAVSSSKACFATVIRTADAASSQQFAIALGSLASLRQALSTGKAEDNLIPFAPQKTFDCGAEKPVILKFAANDERLVVGFEQGPVLVFDVNAFVNSNERPTPLVFQSDASGQPRSIHPNPGDHPELVAVLRGVYGQDRGLYVEILDVMNHKIVDGWFSSTSLDAMPTSVSWSARGKQIAIGTHSGDILLYTPQDTSMLALKGHVPRPSDPALAGCCAFATTWLSNTAFHVIYANPRALARWDPDAEDHPDYHHRIVVHDKTNPGEFALSDNPCTPYGAKRLPGPTNVVLKNWGTLQFLIFAGDGPSSDIGAIGCVSDKWGTLSLDETARAALPLTGDMDESALFGLELDLTSPEPVDISAEQADDSPPLPPAPILFAYTSEGWLLGWHVIAQKEGQYPGLLVAPGSSQMSTKPITPPTQPAASAFGSAQPQQPSPFGTAAAAKTTSPFGAPQPTGAFGSASSAPTFGQTGFGGSAAAPTFGSTGFGSAPPPAAPAASSPFGSVGGGGGAFAAFANKPSAFGAPTSATPSPFAAAAAAAKTGETKPVSAFNPTPAAPTFGSASAPSAGPTFGQSGFGFGKPATPAFGQTGFGFGQPSASAAPASGSGFGAFANKTPSFGAGSTASPAAEPSKSATPEVPAATGGGFAAFASKTPAFGSAAAPPAADAAKSSGPFSAFANKTPSFGSGSTAPPATDTAKSSGPFSAFANKPPAFSTTPPATEAPKFGGLAGPTFGTTPAFGQPQPNVAQQPKAPTSTPAASAPSVESRKPPALRSESPPSSDDEQPKPKAGASATSSLASFVKPSSAFGPFGASKDGTPSPFALAASGSTERATVATSGFGQPAALGAGMRPTAGTAFGQTSALGAWGKPPAPPAAQQKEAAAVSAPPAGGGFSAFSGSGGFSAFATGAKPALSGDAAKATSDKKKEEATAIFGDSSSSKSSSLFQWSNRRQAKETPAKDDDEIDASGISALKLDLGDEKAESPQAADAASKSTAAAPPSKSTPAPATPAKDPSPAPTQGSSTPTGTPAKDTPAPTTPATTSAFGAFSKSTSPFGAFAAKEGATPIASAFAPQVQATTTPKKDDAAQSTTPTTTPAASGPVFGKSSFFGESNVFGKSDTPSTPASGSAFSAFAGKPSVFGQTPTKDDGPNKQGTEKETPAKEKDAGASTTPAKSPSLLDRLSPAPAKPSSLLSRMGPPPPVRIEPLPPDSDDNEEEGEEEYEEGELPEGEEEEEEFDSEEEYELEEGDEEEEEEGEDEEPADSPTKVKQKAKSEDPPAPASIFKVPEIKTTKPEPARAASEPASPFKVPANPPAEATPAKPSLLGLGRPALGGAPARSSPLASNPPVTASEGATSAGITQPKAPLGELSLPPKPGITPFPGFTDSAKKPMPSFSGFPAPPMTPTPANALSGGKFTPAPFPATASPMPALFGDPNRSTAPSPATFPGAGPKPAFSLSPATFPTVSSPSPPSHSPAPQSHAAPQHPVPDETPLQQQFAEIYLQMTRELEQLGADARKWAQQRVDLAQPRGGRTPADLRNPDKWGVGDLVAFQQIIKNFEKEAMGLKDHSLEISTKFAELQSLLLQGEVKKEEMVRYARANRDPEFKHMISVRGLGPEQEESQAKLRKQIQAVGDRVQQLEDVLSSLQRKLEAHNSGRYRIEAPTLDTINRTCRNIDIALEQRAMEISELADRVAKLPLTSAAAPAPASMSNANAEKKHARAASLAHAKAADAALAAEHSAERLKNILNRARTEPILSVVSSAPPVRHISRPAAAQQPSTSKTPPMSQGGGFFGFSPGATLPKTPPKFEWTPQSQAGSPAAESDDGSPLASRGGSGSGSRRQARHSGSVKFEKKEASSSSSQVVPFEWGPLPDFAAGKK